jgi:hypothetical protein
MVVFPTNTFSQGAWWCTIIMDSVIELLYVDDDDTSEWHYPCFAVFERHILMYGDEENIGERDVGTDRL